MTTLCYVVDGQTVRATSVNRRRPRVYVIRFEEGPVLGYVRSALFGRSDAYLGDAVPDAMGAHLMGTYSTMRYAVEHVARAARNAG